MKLSFLVLGSLLVLAIAIIILLPACTAVQQEEIQTWLDSPATQEEIGILENFAFSLLNAYLESHMTATASGVPNFAPAEPGIIAQVQAKYGLTHAQATYVVRKAEARFTSIPRAQRVQ